jgi:hypothetical protein
MTALNFNDLFFLQQIEMVLKETRIANRNNWPYYIYLYNVHEFYIEVFYDINTDIIAFMQAFSANSRLLPYIEEFPITYRS